MAAHEPHIERLQNAPRVTVNDELVFPSGDWQMPADAQQSIAKDRQNPRADGADQDRRQRLHRPISPGLMRQGITSNLILS